MYTLSARKIRDAFLNGEKTAVSIVEEYLKRIDAYDKDIGAFLTVFGEKALGQARALDAKKAAGKPLGKLAGVPIGIKDNMHVKGEKTTCASKMLENYTAPFDATVVRLLESEDAIIIGKMNLDEFAMGSSTEFSALQQTNNPWDLSCVPGGSSGGPAAAVAARMCPIALGSDTGGSIRQPASLCGVVGYKPTYGRVSRYGLVAFGSSLDQIGPFATSVEDVAMMMEVMGQHCEKDSTSVPQPSEDFLGSLDDSVAGKKVGVPWHLIEDLSPEMRENFDASLEVFKGLGCSIVDVSLPLIKYSISVYYIVATAEASTNLARFDGVRYGERIKDAKNLDDLYMLTRAEGFGPEVTRRIFLGTFVLASGFQDAYYKKAQKIRTLMIEEYQRAFEVCDVIALPVSPFPAFKRGAIQDPLEMYLADMYTISSNLVGIPAISVPAGFNAEGMPLGVQLQAPQLHDVELCNVAYAYEKATGYTQKIPAGVTL
jgi:aspartyl-tRNA(Asn)/glutamyl-tRNA(Gln) amidotransferase subunit A